MSVVQAMQSRKPLLWDMYKEIGGFPAEQSEQFLMFGKFDPSYRSIHTLLNQEATRKITWQDIEQILENEKAFPVFEKENVLNLVQETKKHIDRFYFSL